MRSSRRQLRAVARLAAWLLAGAAPGFAAAERSPAHHAVPPTEDAITVDGRLDEKAWRDALVVTLDYEVRPGENTTPPARTEMLVTHDRRQLYVAFRAHDPDPEAIRARLADRDQAWGDDIVGITIDTFNDERRAFEFWVNPLGVQLDLFYDDLSGSEDSSWDALWESAGRLTDGGFEVEMAIPFSSLRFPKSSGPQTWGFDAIRFWPRDRDYSFRSQPQDRDRSCYVCQFSKMTGFAGISPGRNLELNPTLTGGRTDRRELGEPELEAGSADGDAGLTVRWGLTPNLTLDATLNPDFSQVEADVAQLEVNNQFALFFPEKRPFFLEGADFFQTPFNVVHTRQIADPDFGLKLTGKQGKNAIGVFVAEDATTNLLIPGSQGSRLASIAEENAVAVLRLRRDVGKNSAIGLLVTDRQGQGRYENRVAGIDGLFRFTDSDNLRFQFLGSQTRYPDELARQLGQPQGDFDDVAYRLAYRHNSRGWNGYATYESIGTDFRADLGFMPRGDRSFWVAGIERQWWGEEGDFWSRLWVGSDYDVTEDQSGQLLEREFETWGSLLGPLQSFASVRYGRRERFFNGRSFEESFRQIYFELRPTGDVFFGMFARRGDNIDFAGTRPGKQLLLEPQVRWNAGIRLKLSLNHTFDRLDVDGGTLFTANLSEVRAVYQFNRRMFVRLISQFLDLERDPSLYAFPVDARSQDLLNELLVSYKLNARTAFFAGYSDNYRSDDRFDLVQTNRTLFMKIGYAWVM